MRLLHTGDWHLKERLGWQDRHADLKRSLENIRQILFDKNVDVMVVAGDLFRERLRKEEFEEAVADIASIFGSWLAAGGTMVAISGNHDNAAQFNTLLHTTKLNPGTGRGRSYFFARPDVLVLEDKNGLKVQFVLMPYPDDAFLRAEWKSAGEQNARKQDTYRAVLQKLQDNRIDKSLPSVLVSHIHVRGVGVGRNAYQINEESDILFDVSDIPLEWAYGAFGHIHQPQPVTPGATHANYCGSIERLDAGEKGDEKGVWIVDIWPGGQKTTPEWVPLPCVTNLRQIILNNPTEELTILQPDDTSLVQAVVRYVAGRDNLGHIRRRLRALYPRLYSMREERIAAVGEAPTEPINLENVRENVIDYLSSQLKAHPQRETLLSMVKEILP